MWKFINKSIYYQVLAFAAVFILSFSGCEDSFSIYDISNDEYYINGVIDSRNEVNKIRIARLSQPGKEILSGNTSLILSESWGKAQELQKSEIDPNGKYITFDLPANYMKRGYNYRLTVVNDSYDMKWVDFVYPSKPMWMNCSESVKEGDMYPGLPNWIILFTLSCQQTGGYFQRLYVRYETNVNGVVTQKIKQLPQKIYENKLNPTDMRYPWEFNYEEMDFVYPTLTKFTSGNYGTVSIQYESYNTLYPALKYLEQNVEPKNIKILGLFFVFYQVDETTYKVIEGAGNSAFSIRLDQTVVETNVKGLNGDGIGYVGAISTDTLRVNLFPNYIDKLGYVNGQSK